MNQTLNKVLEKIEAANRIHGKKLRKRLSDVGRDYYERADKHYADYDSLMKGENKSIDFGVQCYLRMCDDMQKERLAFLRTGKYSNTSYKEVEQSVYRQPEVMDYHMHGLAMAQFLWMDQYYRLRFFCDTLPLFATKTRSYLEIGGGHGLYTKEALNILNSDTRINLLDISERSLRLARGMIGSPRVNYFLKDLFEWQTEEEFDFITIAEVIEHVEKPDEMMHRVRQLLQRNGVVFVTTPVNAPMIDHIYLFNNVNEIRDLLIKCGFRIIAEKSVIGDDVSEAIAVRNKVPIMYAAFLERTDADDLMQGRKAC